MIHPLRNTLTSFATPEESLNQILQAARTRLVGAPPGTIPDGLLIPALLAVGDQGAALDRLRSLRDSGVPGPALLASYASWSGDQHWLGKLSAEALRDVAGVPMVPSGAVEVALALWRSSPLEISPPAAADLILTVMQALWRIDPSAAGESVSIEPSLPGDWNRMSLEHLRIGQTLLNLVVRRTRDGLAVTAVRGRGPAIRLVLTIPGATEFEVDGVTLRGGRAVFRVEGEHQVTVRN